MEINRQRIMDLNRKDMARLSARTASQAKPKTKIRTFPDDEYHPHYPDCRNDAFAKFLALTHK
jgi:hypothetical protein